MLLIRCVSVILLSIVVAFAGTAQETGAAELNSREQSFIDLLSNVELVGVYTLDNALEGAAPATDRYTIKSVSKLRDGVFQFDAVMRYSEREIPVAIALPVQWAGDTPVITLTNLAIPGAGTYTARVLFYGDRYAGTWQGREHGGHMYGRIVRLEVPRLSEPGVTARRAGVPEQTTTHWPSFRGNFASGQAEGFALPTEWSVEEGRHVLWKTPIPGLAHSSPIIWGDRVFLTSAVRKGEEDAPLTVGLYGSITPVEDEGAHHFNLYCLDKRTGEMIWERTAIEATPKVKRHPKGSHAASTPATDGKHVVAFFASEGLYCYDIEGNLLWSKDLGLLDSGYYLVKDAQWGFASSPVIYEGLVIVQCDVQSDSFLAAFDVTNGEEVWRKSRDEVPTWGTPTVHITPEREQVIVNGWKHIGGYDLRTGEELWKLKGGGDIPVPTPVVAHDLIYITNAHGRTAPILAIRTSASGELESFEDEDIAWSYDKRGNYMQTPLVMSDYIYLCNDAGVLTCYDARSGELIYRERLGGGRTGFTASGVGGDGKLYFTSEEGEVHVVKAGPQFELLAVNPLGETCMASPAISEGTLFFRARHHLFAIAEH